MTRSLALKNFLKIRKLRFNQRNTFKKAQQHEGIQERKTAEENDGQN